ncbi:MAG: FG-GAP repeat domain-containing protein [Isosphaeraceae bacterium]
MKPRLILCIVAVIIGLRAEAQDWPRYGYDGALTGRTPARGAITAPRVAWTFSVAGRELLVVLQGGPGEHQATLDAGARGEPGGEAVAPAGPLRLDIDGRGTLRPALETYHERWAKILPKVAGSQRVCWNHTWTDQPVCRLQLFAYDRGFEHPRLVWESNPPEATVFNPLNIVCDVDGDGVQEICVAAHYRVMIFEGTTGRKETELRYHTSRPYGWFGLADVDGDGQNEFVTIGDFQSHIDVLDYDRGRPEAQRLRVKWRRDVETDIEKRVKWPQVGPHPLADVTGDGRPEIVFNLFNDTGDGQWHGVVLDATSGKALRDLPRRFIQGTADVDGDGAAELFTIGTDGELVPLAGQVELITVQEPTPRVRWSSARAGWCLADLPRLGPSWSTTASQGMQHVLLQGAKYPVFFVKTWATGTARRVTISAMRGRADGKVQTLWTVGGVPETAELISMEESSPQTETRALLRARLAANETANLVARRVRPQIVESRPLRPQLTPPIVARLGEGKARCVIVEGAGQNVFAIAPPPKGGRPPQLLWQRPGRGMHDGSRMDGLLAVDLDHDGMCEVVAADQARSGHALLLAYHGDGSVMWEKAFPHTSGAPPVWNTSALTFWWPGHFRQPDQVDLLVSTRRRLMHSDVGQLINGRTGATLWTREKADVAGQFHWGWGGSALAAVDVDGDRRDELISLYPVCFWIAEGDTGLITTGRTLASRQELPAWAAYGEPIVHDFNADSKPEILLDSPYILALLDLKGKPLWHGPGRVDFPVSPGQGDTGETTSCKHALVDIDGDGSFEIASAGYGDGVRLIDPRSGERLWSLSAPAPTGPKVAAANIDGKGGDEILYPAGSALVAVTGDRKSGKMLWVWQGPADLSMPAIADVDADGRAEIVVQDARGDVHCLLGSL